MTDRECCAACDDAANVCEDLAQITREFLKRQSSAYLQMEDMGHGSTSASAQERAAKVIRESCRHTAAGGGTPRTDAFANEAALDQTLPGICAEWAAFARQLERELSAKPSAAGVAEKVREACCKSRLFNLFTQQGFWHAHYVDLIWRHNGQDVREPADWLKDIWYLVKDLSAIAGAGNAPPTGSEG